VSKLKMQWVVTFATAPDERCRMNSALADAGLMVAEAKSIIEAIDLAGLMGLDRVITSDTFADDLAAVEPKAFPTQSCADFLAERAAAAPRAAAPDGLDDLIRRFRDSLNGELSHLATYLAGGSLGTEAAAALHRIAGAATIFGFPELGLIASAQDAAHRAGKPLTDAERADLGAAIKAAIALDR
jgi:HPt (histidine-containing phosphotransfer) domain-containing protein